MKILLSATPQPHTLESLRLKNSCAIPSAELKSRGRPDNKQRMHQPSLHREHKPVMFPAWPGTNHISTVWLEPLSVPWYRTHTATQQNPYQGHFICVLL